MTFDPLSSQITDQNLNAIPVTKVLFVDSRVPDLQAITAAAEPGVKIVVLDANQDGVQQMASALQGMHGLDSIGVVSHGDEGVLLLGNGPLFAGNIETHQAALAAIGAALGPNGDILLYGCDVGRGDSGARFLNALAAATGADVAASSDSTGDAARGGDWNLEITTGSINGTPVLDAQALTGYHYLLHTASVSTVAQLKAAITTGNTDGLADTITLTGNITFASAADAISINVTDGQTMSIVGGGFKLDGANLARVLNVSNSGGGSAVTIDNLTITNGLAVGAGGSSDRTAGVVGSSGLGGGIYNTGNLTISNSTITTNKASGGGGSGGSSSLNNGGGGGGGGFGAGIGGVGGSSGYGTGPATTPSAGTGGQGGPGGARTSGGGLGGSSIGGAGGAYGNTDGYSVGGSGGTANNGTISIGGGGGGAGGNNTGGVGGSAAGGIYSTGTLTITSSTITNNIGAGGGGGGGGAGNYVGTGNGGAGGIGVGGIWSTGTLIMDTSSSSSLATGNVGAGGNGGGATGTGNNPGVAGASTNGVRGAVTNYVPPASVTSATYDASTGTLVVTGVNMVTGDTIDVSKLSLTGQGGSYTLTSANVTAASATSFTVTLNAADKLNINGMLNKNGTSAVDTTTFNLAAAANWDANSSSSADLTGNGVTVSNATAPTITSATFDSSTNLLVVTGTGLVKTIGATNDITVSKLTITGEGGATYTLSTTGNVEVTSATSFSITLSGADIAGVNALLNKNGTSSAASATTYNMAAADDWDSVITGGNIADLTGNGITVSNAAPIVISSTYDASTGTLVVTGANMVTGDTIDVSKLSLTGQGGSYTLTSPNVTAASATSFTVTLNAADQLNINGILNKNGTSAVDTTTFNLAAAASWDASRTTSADLTSNGVTASNVTAPTITSATFDGSTNVLVVTGTGLVKTVGATNDITVSKLTITGEGGATYTLSTTGNIEVTSATSFSITLSGADIAGVSNLLNKNGTSSISSTTYNLAAADDWNSVVTSGNIADLTGNGITVSNAAPIVISSTYDASTGSLVVTGANMVAGDTIDVTKLSLSGQGGSYTLTSPNITAASATSFTVTLNATDKLNINGLLNQNGTAAVDTTTFNLAAAASWDASRTSGADLTSNGVTVSNVTTPTITSATFDGSTNLLVVTGTGLVKTIGTTNDITVSKLTITGEGGATYTLSTTGNVEVTSATSFSITLSGADIAGVSNLLNKNGTSSISSTTYNLAAADDWNSVITGGNIADLTGNGITVSNAAPIVISSTYDASTGTLVVTGANMVAGDTIDVTKLSLSGQGGSYTLSSPNVTAASTTSFTVTLNAADQLNINGILNKNGTSAVDTTTFNLAAAASWDASRTSGADLTGNGVTVSNVTAPTITSATFNASTNVFVVTGTGLVKTIGATNDITVSKLTITGEGGSTYTLSTTSNVEVTSATSFSITLSGADIAGVNALLNQNGTSSATSATTYNLAAADDWNSVITSGNIADLTGNGITVSNAAPIVISSTYDASTGTLVVTGANMVTGDTIDVAKLSLSGQGGSYTLTSPNVTAASATSFTVTLNAADQLNINGILNKNGTSAVDTTTFNLAAAANWDASSTTSADLTGNGVTVSNVTAPTITSASFDVATNVLVVAGTGLVKTIGATNDITISKLTITGEGGATYTLSTTGNVEVTSATSFALTLAGADQAAIEALFNKNGNTSTGGTTYNLAAADDWDSVITGGNIAVTTSPITVSNIAVPTITSATYNASTGALVVTGTGFLSKSGAANDIVANKFTFTGEGSSTYTLTDTANIDITSGTAFTLTLSATDKAAIGLMANKAGTSSTGGTTYNIAAAEDWAAGADSAVVVADTTGNGVTVSNVAVPTLTSATYNSGTGSLVVTGSGFLSKSGAANDIDVSKLSIAGDSTAYTLTSSSVDITSATSFTVTLNGTDKTALTSRINKAGTASLGNVTYNLVADEDWAAGADAAIVIADLTGNGITATLNAPPTITSNGGGAAAAISIPENSLAVTTLTANDGDGDTLTFSLTGGADQSRFVINPSSGVLSFALSPNFENPTDTDLNNTYIVQASVDDGHGGTAQQTLTITVTDVNENVTPPNDTPAPGTVDGVTVSQTTDTTNSGQTVTTLSVPVVTAGRVEDSSTSHGSLADIPIATGSNGSPLIQIGLPIGIGLTSQAVTGTSQSLREQLIAATSPKVGDTSVFSEIVGNGIDLYVPSVSDQQQVTVRTVTLNSSGNAPSTPIVISGALGAGEDNSSNPLRQEALIIDARNLPSGTVLQFDNVEFAVIIGSSRIVGGNGRNFVIGDNASQFIVLGADDDVLHGGGGDDTVGSRGGNDQLFGEEGNDRVVGGEGNDRLDGGSGDDILQGGQSDAGTWHFSLNANKQFLTTFTAGESALAANASETWLGSWNASSSPLTANRAVTFGGANAGSLETVTLLYHAVLDRAPSVAEMNSAVGLGLSDLQLADLVYNLHASGRTFSSQATQLQELYNWLWGNGTVSDSALQAASQQLAEGGSWGGILLDAIHQTAFRQPLLDANGNLQLTQNLVSGETGWSADTGNDVLNGGDGNDLLIGGRGSDTLAGGNGIDTAAFSGRAEDYALDPNTDGYRVTATNGDIDSLSGIERLRFADKQLALDVGSSGHAGQALEFIGALAFGRHHDAPLLGTLLSLFDQGKSLHDVNELAINLGIVRQLAGSDSNLDLVRLVYRNITGNEASTAQTNALTELLQGNGGSMSQADFLTAAGQLDLNQQHVNLVGLALTGVEYI